MAHASHWEEGRNLKASTNPHKYSQSAAMSGRARSSLQKLCAWTAVEVLLLLYISTTEWGGGCGKKTELGMPMHRVSAR